MTTGHDVVLRSESGTITPLEAVAVVVVRWACFGATGEDGTSGVPVTYVEICCDFTDLNEYREGGEGGFGELHDDGELGGVRRTGQ